MPKLKKNVNHDFTVIGNSIFRDPKLKGIDRGILGTMLSLADGWNFSIKGLAKILPDGETAIANSLKRIEKAHYLIRRRVYENGKITDWEYIISDEPMEVESDTAGESNELENMDNNSKSAKRKNANGKKRSKAVSKLYVAKQGVENLDVENQDVVIQDLENPHDNKISNNKESNNKISIDKSINQSETRLIDMTDRIDKNEYHRKLEEIHERIEMDYLLSQKDNNGMPIYQTAELNELVELIAWAELTKLPSLKIGGENIDAELVKARFSKLDESHIAYVYERIHETASKITNRRSYLLTCLYNAPSSIDGYISNQITHDMKNMAQKPPTRKQ